MFDSAGEGGDETFGIGDRDREAAVSQSASRFDSGNRAEEPDADAALDVGGEGEAAIGKRKSWWPDDLQNMVGAGDRYLGDVVERRVYDPWAETPRELGIGDIDVRAPFVWGDCVREGTDNAGIPKRKSLMARSWASRRRVCDGCTSSRSHDDVFPQATTFKLRSHEH